MKMMNIKNNPKKQHGISLLEAVIALVVAALGILSVLGTQMRTISDSQTSLRRGQAIRLIEDLSERMHAHPNAMHSLSSYVSTSSATTSNTSCSSNQCNAAQLASHDINLWKQSVANQLPLGKAYTFLASGDSSHQLGVLIAWRENERSDANADYLAAINTTAGNSASGVTNASASCPPNHTCHLQYISAPARCAIQQAGSSAAPAPYCAGSVL